MPDTREVLAVLVVVGSFGLVGGYVFTGHGLDTATGVALIAFTGPALGGVLGFYFGKSNGAAAQLAQSSVQFATMATQTLALAAQRRAGDAPASSPTVPIGQVAAPAMPAMQGNP